MGSPSFQLLERYRVPALGRLEAWSIQERYGLALLAVSAVLAVPAVHLTLQPERPSGYWALVALAGIVFVSGLAVMRLRETLRVDAGSIRHSTRSLFGTHSWEVSRDKLREVRLSAEAGRGDGVTVYPVTLVLDADEPGRSVRVVRTTDETRARKAADEIAAALSLCVVDAIGKEPIVDRPCERTTPVDRADAVPARRIQAPPLLGKR